MTDYLIRRLLLAIPTLVLVSVVVFAMLRLVPGDVITLLLEDSPYATEPEKIAQLRAQLGLDRPIYEQYLDYMGRALRGDLGKSLITQEPVLPEILRRIPVTVELALVALFTATIVAVAVGVLAALSQDTWVDYIARSAAVFMISMPSFWVATLVVVLPAKYLGLMPSTRFVPFFDDPLANLSLFLVPGLLLGLSGIGGMMRMTRTMMLEVLRQDYIRTAWAKGLNTRVVIYRHALKNALIPVITILGLQVASLLGGTVIIEAIFGLPGMGRYLLESITWRDYTSVQGINLIFVGWVLLVNLGVDLGYAALDPRIRYR